MYAAIVLLCQFAPFSISKRTCTYIRMFICLWHYMYGCMSNSNCFQVYFYRCALLLCFVRFAFCFASLRPRNGFPDYLLACLLCSTVPSITMRHITSKQQQQPANNCDHDNISNELAEVTAWQITVMPCHVIVTTSRRQTWHMQKQLQQLYILKYGSSLRFSLHSLCIPSIHLSVCIFIWLLLINPAEAH